MVQIDFQTTHRGRTTRPNQCSKVVSNARVLATPWLIAFIALYVVTLPWIGYSIFVRYFLKPEWNAALPGLDRTPWLKITMRSHMACGALSVLLGPIQFIPHNFRRPSSAIVHRWSGRIYCTCAILSSLLGLIFIALKGKLVGGWNMTAAFAAAGVVNGILGFKAWQTARAAKVASAPLDFSSHRNWGIRSYSQILAPVLYRYWYITLHVLNLYKLPLRLKEGLVCGPDDVCPDYLRLLDMLHCWTYWLTALAVAELVIYFLPDRQQKRLLKSEVTAGPCHSKEDFSTRTAKYGVKSDSSPAIVNTIGWTLAVVTMIISIKVCIELGFTPLYQFLAKGERQ